MRGGAEVNDKLTCLGLRPIGADFERTLKQKRFGEMGKLRGVEGVEYGRLGGRPRELRASEKRRLRGAPKKRDDSFGWLAKIEVAELVDKVVEITKLAVDDVYTYLSQQTGRPKAKIKLAHEKVETWRANVRARNLGGGSKGSLRTRGRTLGYSNTFSTSKGLRAPGGGAKAIFSDLYPAVKLFFVLERANGRYVDREDLVVS